MRSRSIAGSRCLTNQPADAHPPHRRSATSRRRCRSASTPRSHTWRSTSSSSSNGAAVVAGGTGLYLRAALADLEIPPGVAPGESRRRRSAPTTPIRPRRTSGLRQLDPAAAAPSTSERPPARRPCARAGARRRVAHPATDRAVVDADATSDARRGPRPPAGRAGAADRGSHRRDDRARRRRRGPRQCSASRSRTRRRQALGLDELATLPLDEARERIVHANPPLRRVPAQVDAPDSQASCSSTPTGRPSRSWMRSSTWRALGNTYVVVEPGEPLDAAAEQRPRTGNRRRPRDPPARTTIRVGSQSGTPTGRARSCPGTERASRRRGSQRSSGRARRHASTSATASRARASCEDGRHRAGPRRRRRSVRPRRSTGSTFVPVSVGNPHAVVIGDPARDRAKSARSSRRTCAFRTARTSRSRASTAPAR